MPSQPSNFIINTIAFLCGLLFAIGLTISQMVNPNKVLNFLDLFGTFDASLALVMVGALTVFCAVYWLIIKRRQKPIITDEFSVSNKTKIDQRLIIGSAIFGIGWGISGICPGPALANIISGHDKILAFILMMLVGVLLSKKVKQY
ncbi:YeeE/YedE family protein [Thalassotalea ponticola]|uniref:YeeE/YedE family protein n=1 Tax=Thalassotalea ponticola TaxID=1523392 RepID=UPI0025B5240E|nr:YeeE/YedE family protein [Thalassotalea ponticola]MDN3653275.1 YeeE/YedE family protein [Thalassotalea ponticola]